MQIYFAVIAERVRVVFTQEQGHAWFKLVHLAIDNCGAGARYEVQDFFVSRMRMFTNTTARRQHLRTHGEVTVHLEQLR
ncbi:hypothetical protein D3C75_1026410 [compost metagenome]